MDPAAAPLPHHSRFPSPHGGSAIFALQVVLVVLVPFVGYGQRLAPLSYVAAMIAVQSSTVALLGYRRTAAGIVLAGSAVLAGVVAGGGLTVPLRLLLWATLIAGGLVTVALTLRASFAARIPAVQRIFCGAAAYVMLGFVFAAIHGLTGFLLPGAYVIQPGLEGVRPIHWSDYVWLSFATLTTAGFGDVVGIGSAASAVSSLEAIAGILFPATLIARIASLADATRRA